MISSKSHPLHNNYCTQCRSRNTQQQQQPQVTQPRSNGTTKPSTHRQTSTCHSTNLNLTNGTSTQHNNLVHSYSKPPLIRYASSSAGSASSNETILRKRRRRTIAEGGQGVMASKSGGVNGSRRTKGSSRLCCDHSEPHQHQDATVSESGSFWSRHLARFVLHPRLRVYFRSAHSSASSMSPYTAVLPLQEWSLPAIDSSKPSVTGKWLPHLHRTYHIPPRLHNMHPRIFPAVLKTRPMVFSTRAKSVLFVSIVIDVVFLFGSASFLVNNSMWYSLKKKWTAALPGGWNIPTQFV
jgi:hypothetical protein